MYASLRKRMPFAFTIVVGTIGLAALGASPTETLAAVSAPNAATASVPPTNWPWHGIAMKSPTGANRTYDGSTPDDLQKMYDTLGVNSAHIYLKASDLWTNQACDKSHQPCTADAAWDQTMEWLDTMLDKCRSLGITAVIETDSIEEPDNEGYYTPDTTPITSPTFWGAPGEATSTGVEQLYLQAQKLADHMVAYNSTPTTGNNPLSYAYDIISEPTEKIGGVAHSPYNWATDQENLVEVIRNEDPTSWIVVKPGKWGSDYQGFEALNYPRLVYSVHVYDPNTYTNQSDWHYIGAPWPSTYPPFPAGTPTYYDEDTVWSDLHYVKQFAEQANPPYPIYMYVGEFSALTVACDSNVWLANMMDIWENRADPPWGWAYQSQGGFEGWSPDYVPSASTVPPITTSTEPYNVTYTPIPETSTSTTRWADLKAMFMPSAYTYPSAEGVCDP